MTLHDKQVIFARNVADLINYINANNHSVTFGECYRTPEQAKWNADHGSGIEHSLHTERLAIDLHLFDFNGNYLDDKCKFEPFGKYWKSLHTLNRWGGDFIHLVDSNHFEMQNI